MQPHFFGNATKEDKGRANEIPLQPPNRGAALTLLSKIPVINNAMPPSPPHWRYRKECSFFTIRPRRQFSNVQMLHLFQSFIAKMKHGFYRIARATRNEMTVEDLHNDSWVLALEIGDRRGRPIDFSDPADQELVMRAVNLQNVRRGDWKMRHSVRIDQEPECEEGIKLVDRLPARASSDPLVSLQARESARDIDAILAASYSQAAAYAITFINLKNDRQMICNYFAVSGDTLTRRTTVAASTMRSQPSIFDRIERIPANFMPLRGKQYSKRITETRESDQEVLTF